jgi:hypothetical protein
MTDEKLKLEEIEVSHKLGRSGEVPRGEGSGEGVDATQLSGTLIYNNFYRHNKSGWVAITDALVCQEGGDFWSDLNPALTFLFFFSDFYFFSLGNFFHHYPTDRNDPTTPHMQIPGVF